MKVKKPSKAAPFDAFIERFEAASAQDRAVWLACVGEIPENCAATWAGLNHLTQVKLLRAFVVGK